jgi:gamma-glutamylcyclotransferase (GGCT)/AIG2-like uncharacterized protein YtfP
MNYFAYGSNLDFNQMKRRCPSARLVGPARLPGYRLAFTYLSTGWNCGMADIVPDPECEVFGVVYDIGKKDLAALDDYEGHPTAYRRCRVDVACDSGPLNGVLCYEVVEKRERVRPSAHYLGIILRAADHYGFPAEYRAFLRSFLAKS